MKLWVVACKDVFGENHRVIARAETPWQAKRFLASEAPDGIKEVIVFELKSTGDPGVLDLEDYYEKCKAKRKRKEANAPTD